MSKKDIIAINKIRGDIFDFLGRMYETPYQGADLADACRLLKEVNAKLYTLTGSTR